MIALKLTYHKVPLYDCVPDWVQESCRKLMIPSGVRIDIVNCQLKADSKYIPDS